MHPCLDINVVKDIVDITKSVCNEKQVQKALQICPIFITDAYHDDILDGIMCIYHIEYQRPINENDIM